MKKTPSHQLEFCDCYDHDFRRAVVKLSEMIGLQPINNAIRETATMYVKQAHEIDTQRYIWHLKKSLYDESIKTNLAFAEGIKNLRDTLVPGCDCQGGHEGSCPPDTEVETWIKAEAQCLLIDTEGLIQCGYCLQQYPASVDSRNHKTYCTGQKY